MTTTNTVWDLSGLYSSDNDPQIDKDIAKVEKAYKLFARRWLSDDSYLQSVTSLRTALDEYNGLLQKYANGGNPSYYFWLRSKQDQSDSYVKAKLNMLIELDAELENSIQFFSLNLSKLPVERQKKLLSSPQLQDYGHLLSRLFEEGKHNLSDAEEKIMNLKYNPAHLQWVNMVSERISLSTARVLNDEKKLEEMPFEEVLSHINSAKKPVRTSAAEAVNTILASHRDIATAEMNAILSNKKIDDSLRGFTRADEQRHLADDIATETIDTALEAIAETNKLSQEFYKIKATLLKQPKLAYHERNIPTGSLEKKYSFDEGKDLVLSVFAKLDSEFHDIAKDFFDAGRVDVFPAKGKYGGAFCVYGAIEQPVFILLNYTERLRDVTTLAHELGHGIHDELVRKSQPAIYFGTSTATAEVASQFLEDFVIEEVLQELTPKEQLSVLMERFSDDVSSMHRQVACYRFEQDLHREFREHGFLDADTIGRLFQARMKEYMGSAVEQSDGSENWWVYWSHIRSFFYTYSYASGRLIARSLQALVREDQANIAKVKEFLSAGTSASTEDIFKTAGLDITKKTFWQNGLKGLEADLKQIKSLIKQIDA